MSLRLKPTHFADAWIVEGEPFRDQRGSFERTFCENEFAAAGLETRFVQHSLSNSQAKGTVRGMHFQRPPHAEVKLVGCVQG